MALNNLEDRLECAIRHINTALDIDPWAQNLAVESMRMRIALMKGGQPEIIRCKDCKYGDTFHEFDEPDMPMKCLGQHYGGTYPDDFCSYAERRTDDGE